MSIINSFVFECIAVGASRLVHYLQQEVPSPPEKSRLLSFSSCPESWPKPPSIREPSQSPSTYNSSKKIGGYLHINNGPFTTKTNFLKDNKPVFILNFKGSKLAAFVTLNCEKLLIKEKIMILCFAMYAVNDMAL